VALYRVLLWTTVLFAGLGLSAQDLRFQHLTTDAGLSDNAITCVYEDREGFIWIGTENGLDRYDGSRVWNVPNTAMHITAITGDRDGAIWAATKDQGLLLVDARKGVSHAFRAKEGRNARLCSDLLTALYDLNDTTLLIGAREHGLFFFDKRMFSSRYWADSLDLSPTKGRTAPPHKQGWCHAITPLNDSLFWIGFLHSGRSLVVDRKTLRTVQQLSIRREGSESQTCAALVGDTLFTGGWQNDIDAVHLTRGPAALIKPARSIMRIPVADEVNALIAWDGHHLLAGSRGIGLFLMDVRTGTTRRFIRSRGDANSLADDRIRALLRGKRGTLWVATANGLDRFVPAVWAMDRTELFADPRADHPELFFHRVEPFGPHGARVFSSGGFFLVDDLQRVRRLPVEFKGRELQPTVLGPSTENGRMLGTEYGIVLWNEESGRITGLRTPSVSSGTAYPVGGMYQVRGLFAAEIGGRNTLLAATLGYGVHAIDMASDAVKGVAMSLPGETSGGMALVNDVLVEANGRFLYATADGVVHWSTKQPLTSAGLVGEGSGQVIARGEDVRGLLRVDGTLWAVARAGALIALDDDVTRRFEPPPPIHRGFQGATADRNGDLWIASDDGLLRFRPQDSSFIHVPVGDGVAVRKLSRAITTLPDGRVAFCADNALFTFDPQAYDHLPALLIPYPLEATVAGRPLSIPGNRAVLSYRSNLIDIAIGSMAHGFARPPVFEYRLDGVEQDWRETSALESIRYAGIPVGEHRLLVRVRDALGRTGAEYTVLTIRVKGPVWQEWWFYALALLVVSTGLYAFYNFRLKQTMKLQSVRNRIASDLHDEVGSSLSSITIGAQLATRLSPDASEQVKTLLARMGETSSQSLRSISDIVWAIDPKNDEGEALVKRMRRIAQELLESKGVDVSFDVGAGVEDLKLPMNTRKEIVLIYKEAVHNASKYSGAEVVQVSLHRRNGSLSMSVKDDGKGFEPALHPDGHGLGSMHRRAGALGASLDLKSAPGLGTLVALEVDLTRIRD
jgi:two-component sensor histidine kinase/streptogramin lyase